MNFCLCGNSRCICKTSCTCIHRGCLCSECFHLRKKDWCKECGLPLSFRDLAQSTLDVGTCKCEFSSRSQAPAQEIYSPGSTAEVTNEGIKEPESSVPKIEHRAEDLQVSSNRILVSIKREMLPIQDTGANKSYQPAVSSPEYFSRKDSFSKASSKQEKQTYKSITFIKEQALYPTDDSGSSSDEIPVAKEAFDYLSPRSGHQQPKCSQSDSDKSSSDISSTWERVELPSSRSSSGISILELPENESGSSSQAEPHFTGNHLVTISSIKISPNQIENLCLQRPESTTPTMIFGEGTRDDASLGISVSPIQIITTNPRTVLVSSSGGLHLLPQQNSQFIQPQAPASNAIHVSQSSNSDKASSDSAVKISPTDISPINIQSSENSQ